MMNLKNYVLVVVVVLVETGFVRAQDNKDSRTTIVSPQPQPYFMESGDSFDLECEYSDSDAQAAKLVWYKDMKLLKNDVDGFFINPTNEIQEGETRRSTLRKLNATLEDTATYGCRKDGEDEAKSYKMTLTVVSIQPTRDAVAKPKQDLELQCQVEGEVSSYKPMLWFSGGEQLESDAEKYLTNDSNDTLIIKAIAEEEIHDYTCGFKLSNGQSFNETVKVESEPFVKSFEKSKNLVQGDPLTLDCEASGHPAPTVRWLKGGAPIEDDGRVSYRDYEGIVNATIRIENLDFPDRDEYTCVAENPNGSSNSTILVRVKDKLAALWPFLGICAEVAILCIIIFIYERRRAKKMEEEEQQEEAGHLTNSNDHKGKDEIRHRK